MLKDRYLNQTIENFRNSRKSEILFVNSTQYGAGLNFEFATHAVIMHKVDENLKRQIYGRIHRCGLKQVPYFYDILYDNE